MPDYTIGQVAKILGCCKETLCRRARKGELEGAYKISGKGKWMVRMEAIPELRGLKIEKNLKKL